MGWNIQPFEEFVLTQIDQIKIAEGEAGGGSDGATVPVLDTHRTQAIQVFGRPFSIIFSDDTAGLTSTFHKVQVNNRKFIDPNSKYHNATPLDYGRKTIYDKMLAAGVAGKIEPTNLDADFANGWVDYPGQVISSGGNLFNAGPTPIWGWRWVRVVGVTDSGGLTLAPISPTFSAHLYHTGADHTGK